MSEGCSVPNRAGTATLEGDQRGPGGAERIVVRIHTAGKVVHVFAHEAGGFNVHLADEDNPNFHEGQPLRLDNLVTGERWP